MGQRQAEYSWNPIRGTERREQVGEGDVYAW